MEEPRSHQVEGCAFYSFLDAGKTQPALHRFESDLEVPQDF
jgi:hypothetical protein